MHATRASVSTATRRLPSLKFKSAIYDSPLSILSHCNSTEEVRRIHGHLIVTGRIRDTFVATKLVECCAVSAGNVQYAWRIFDRIKDPNSYSWTTIIRGFSEAKRPDKVVEFYNLMRLNNVEENRFTFLFVLKAYTFRRCYSQGRVLHCKVLKLGFDCDMYLNNAMIHFYSKCDDVNSARKLFVEMPVNNLVNWNTLMSACFSSGDIESGRKLFDEMPERDTESWNTAIAGYCKFGHVDTARSLFDLMGDTDRDVVSWATMIWGYVYTRRASEALELFKRMLFDEVKPDNVTVTGALSACAQLGALDMGKYIHAYMRMNNLRNDVQLETALVDMYAKCGSVDIAMKEFAEIPSKNVPTWNAMLSGLAVHGYGDKALNLFEKMEAAGLVPNDVTFVAVLAACSHTGATSEGQRLFDRMQKDFGIVPKIEHYGCMVDILGRGGHIREAKELIQSMPMQPNEVIWGSLLNACRVHGYLDTDEDLLGGFPQFVSGDGGSHVLLSNIFAAKGDWDAVESVRNVVKASTVKRNPGCSVIEVDSVIHEFFVEDRSHLHWMQINETLERLQAHSKSEGYLSNMTFITIFSAHNSQPNM